MTAFGFKARFKPKIIAKVKQTTIRQNRKDGRYPPVGGALQFYTGLRTKQAQNFGNGTAAAVQRIVIQWIPKIVDLVAIDALNLDAARWQSSSDRDAFALRDGFEDWYELEEFFAQTHSRTETFEGYLTDWGDTFVPTTGRRNERKSWPDGHVIHMSLDHTKTPSDSVAECDCGWVSRVPWTKGRYVEQDAACEGHWAAVEAAA